MSMLAQSLIAAWLAAAFIQTDRSDSSLAQSLAPQICSGQIGGASETVIEACTFLIDSGRLAPSQLARAYFGRGLAREEAGQAPAAVSDLSEAIRLGLVHPAAFTARGLARLGTREFDTASADFGEAVRLDSRFAPAYAGRGLLGLIQGRFQDSWNDYDEAVRLNPDRDHYAYGRGVAASRLGRPEGRAAIDAALLRSPNARDYFARFGVTP